MHSFHHLVRGLPIKMVVNVIYIYYLYSLRDAIVLILYFY